MTAIGAGAGMERIAVVNRGEAAIRALQTIAEYHRDGGPAPISIALYTDVDANAWFVREADEAVSLGPATYLDPTTGARTAAYLDHDRVLSALRAAKADAVWVGWGLVSEDADFAARCEQAGITFIGPPSAVIRRLGSKVEAKQVAESVGVPVVPWSGGPVDDLPAALAAGAWLGYPLLVKAVAGGGGRGIRRVADPADLPAAFASARSEADHAFGDPAVFLERAIEGARHIEVQILADGFGTVWSVGVRNCSVQRRNQKVVEESGSTALDPATEDAVKAAAVRICQAVGYRSAGTVEFLYDPAAAQFLFMEVNVRLQVEHPVTEATTGLDLVRLQLHIAAGGRLEGGPPAATGHAIEARLNAEDPEDGFRPAPGRVTSFRLPAGKDVRVDSGVAEGDRITPEFDSMIAKVIAWGRDRPEALARLRRTLLHSRVLIEGGTTNKSFLLHLLDLPEVVEGRVDTRWLDRLTAAGTHLPAPRAVALLQAAVDAYEVDRAAARVRFHATAARGRPELPTRVGHRAELRFRGRSYRFQVYRLGPGRYRVEADGATHDVDVERLGRFDRRLRVGGRTIRTVSDVQGASFLVEVDGVTHRITRDDGGLVRAPAPAFVLSVAVRAGDVVEVGDPLAVVESMKMETTITAPHAGVVRAVPAMANVRVDAGSPLVQVQPRTAVGTRPVLNGGENLLASRPAASRPAASRPARR